MLISEETQEKLNLLIQRFFQHNRSWDNFLGFSNVEWALNHFSEVFHHGLAHLYPLLADVVADIELRYNVVPKYYTTQKDTRIYGSMLEFFNININEHIETYGIIKDAINTATVNGDLNVEADLKSLLRQFNHFMEQAILLRDKAEIYKDNLAMFDGFAEQFYVLEEEKEKLNGND
jgi:hypothetical protein|nr:MAG TPA: hypothetical protein [Caudoviricetes sp.]